MARALWMERGDFAGHARTVIEALPADIARCLHNVEVIVEDWPTRRQLREAGLAAGETLFGLYEGLPQTERGADYGLMVPDRITLFRGPHLEPTEDVPSLVVELRRTLLHELAHHFGIDDDRLHELGAY